MISGFVGRKKGMTHVFRESGESVPVTVIAAAPGKVVQIRTLEKDGYQAIQVGAEPVREKIIGKPRVGHLKKHGAPALRFLKEYRVDSVEGFESGQEIKVDEIFAEGDRVDVQGTSKGRGFAGTIKRHNFHRGDMTHGGMAKRRPGSIGMCATPARVLRGKKMSGHMGNKTVTARNLELVAIDIENGYLLVKGAVPGPINGRVVIRKTTKGVRAPKQA